MPPCLSVSFTQVFAFAFGIPFIVCEFYLYNKNFNTLYKLKLLLHGKHTRPKFLIDFLIVLVISRLDTLYAK